MKRRIALCIAVSLCAGVYAGNNPGIYKKGWIDFNKNGVKDIYEDPSAPIEARVQDLLSQMTLEEKTCQMATLYGSGRVLKDSLPTEKWKDEILDTIKGQGVKYYEEMPDNHAPKVFEEGRAVIDAAILELRKITEEE